MKLIAYRMDKQEDQDNLVLDSLLQISQMLDDKYNSFLDTFQFSTGTGSCADDGQVQEGYPTEYEGSRIRSGSYPQHPISLAGKDAQLWVLQVHLLQLLLIYADVHQSSQILLCKIYRPYYGSL